MSVSTVTPDYSFGFLSPLVAALFALVAFGVGVWIGVADARRGERRRLWPLGVGLYLALFSAQVVVGFRASEAILIMPPGLVSGPLGYWFGSRFKPRDRDDDLDAQKPAADQARSRDPAA